MGTVDLGLSSYGDSLASPAGERIAASELWWMRIAFLIFVDHDIP